MNKKNITLILAGILLLTLQFNIRISSATIDLFSDVLAYILILAGILKLTDRNIMFKKARTKAIIGLIIAVAGQCLNLTDWGDASSQMNTLILAFTTIFTIYFTYYFTEALMLEAKFQEKAAATRSFRINWMILGILIFVNYIAFMSNVSIAAILVQAVTVICAIYYCSSVLTAGRQLYMEGLPTQHMESK